MSQKLKVGIIGVGGISHVHYNGYTKSGLGDVVAICDINPETLAKQSENYKVPTARCFKDYHDLLALKELDAVSVCTPNKLHCPMTVDAFKAGKHVLVEKPMAMSPAEAQQMIDAGVKAGKKLQVGLMNRFRDDATFVHRLVEEGTLGKIYYARCQAIRRRGVPSWGVFGQKEVQGGGPLIDIGVHMIDLTWWLMGKPEPVSVMGMTYRTIGDKPGRHGIFGQWDYKTYTVEDFACAMVRFAGGETMMIESSFNANFDHSREGCHLVGDAGGAGLAPLSVQLDLNGHLTDCTPNDIKSINTPGPNANLTNHEREVRAFCLSIMEDTPVFVPGHEAIITQKIIDGIYRSAEAGGEVAIAPAPKAKAPRKPCRKPAASKR